MSATNDNTDDVEELPERLGQLNSGTHLTTDGPGEFWCPACGARCTRNTSDGTEYGHLLDCPDRDLPDPRDTEEGITSSNFTANIGEPSNRTSKTLERHKAQFATEDD